jgi:hypothetical protein
MECERIVVTVDQQHERSHEWFVQATPFHGPDPQESNKIETVTRP